MVPTFFILGGYNGISSQQSIGILLFFEDIRTAIEVADECLNSGVRVTIIPGMICPERFRVTEEIQDWALRLNQIVKFNMFHNFHNITKMHQQVETYLQRGLTISVKFSASGGRQNWVVATKIKGLVTPNAEVVANKRRRVI